MGLSEASAASCPSHSGWKPRASRHLARPAKCGFPSSKSAPQPPVVWPSSPALLSSEAAPASGPLHLPSSPAGGSRRGQLRGPPRVLPGLHAEGKLPGTLGLVALPGNATSSALLYGPLSCFQSSSGRSRLGLSPCPRLPARPSQRRPACGPRPDARRSGPAAADPASGAVPRASLFLASRRGWASVPEAFLVLRAKSARSVPWPQRLWQRDTPALSAGEPNRAPPLMPCTTAGGAPTAPRALPWPWRCGRGRRIPVFTELRL